GNHPSVPGVFPTASGERRRPARDSRGVGARSEPVAARREVGQVDEAALGEVLATVRAFVRERVVPAEAEIDEKDEIPAPLRDAAREMGLFGFALPEEYGGLGLSVHEEARLVIELGYTTPAFRSMV